MGKPDGKPKPGRFGHISDREKIDFPAYMIINPLFVFTQIFGDECGMGEYRQSGGNYVCENPLSFQAERKDGAAYKISIRCKNSRHTRVFWSSDTDDDGIRNINKNIAIAGRLTGMKFQKTKEFLAALGSSMSSERAYDNIADRIAKACATVAAQSKQAAAATLRNLMGAKDGMEEIMNVTLSCDCSWLTRGQKSRHGVSTGLAALTNQVIDTEVDSTYCTICSVQMMPDPNLSHTCQITQTGGAGTMEITGLKKIFSRSVDLFKFR